MHLIPEQKFTWGFLHNVCQDQHVHSAWHYKNAPILEQTHKSVWATKGESEYKPEGKDEVNRNRKQIFQIALSRPQTGGTKRRFYSIVPSQTWLSVQAVHMFWG